MIDGLQCGYFTRDVLATLKEGGFSCVTSTLGFWEGSQASLDAIGRWRRLARANQDLMLIARTADDIVRAKESGRVAILLGFQNSTLFDGRIDYVELFAELGVRVVQLTYNNQNEAGGSCYEEHDNGLARFGREIVREMNLAGILVDLSHVGDKTTLDAIEWSQKPVAISHANAASLFSHKRNKSDRVLKALAERGGVIGCATYRNITPENACASVRGWSEMVARTVEIAGIDHVAIGTDEGHGNSQADLNWMRTGHWTRGVDYGAGSSVRPGKVPKPDWLPRTSELSKVRAGLLEVGFSEAERDQILAGNWLRVYRAVFPV